MRCVVNKTEKNVKRSVHIRGVSLKSGRSWKTEEKRERRRAEKKGRGKMEPYSLCLPKKLEKNVERGCIFG